jgi:prepilin-type N-terminal cleavage/methylation domain-containing protein
VFALNTRSFRFLAFQRFRFSQRKRSRAFTLLELLAVIAIIAILMVLVVPALTTMKTGNDITTAAYTITSVLEQARNYAMGNNTYVYVGFYEEESISTSATHSTPPYPGKGRIVLATVASKDGTTSCEDPSSTTTNRIPLTANKIRQVGKLTKLEGVHMTDIGTPPTSSPSTAPASDAIDVRPDFPYTSGSPTYDYQNRINSDDTHSPENQTLYPFVAQGYTFYKTLRFNPRGEASINSTYRLRQVAEIGLRPTHGSSVDTSTANVIAIQFGGVGGNFKIYRR